MTGEGGALLRVDPVSCEVDSALRVAVGFWAGLGIRERGALFGMLRGGRSLGAVPWMPFDRTLARPGGYKQKGVGAAERQAGEAWGGVPDPHKPLLFGDCVVCL